MANPDSSRRCIKISEHSSEQIILYKSSLKQREMHDENLKLECRVFNNFEEFSQELCKWKNLQNLHMINCLILTLDFEALPPIRTLKCIIFDKCNENMFKIFILQNTLEKICVSNDDWTWNGFPHKTFNEIYTNCPNFNHLVLNGAGTGSYFDCDEFPIKIEKLETSMITFHWYVGIKTARLNFLELQNGHLKELTIHQLPYDFDGGKVLKYIIEKMNLKTFYYGKIPLILNGQKQKVKEFEATELQITSVYEMLRQFESIEKFTLKLSNTDISSNDIDKIINPPTDIFNNIKEFEVIDNSSYRGIFWVFLGLYRNLGSLTKLTFKTQDRNINTILECLPIMSNLLEIQLTSLAPRASEIFQTILKLAPNIKIIRVPDIYVAEARGNIGGNIEIAALNQPTNEGYEQPAREERGDEDDDSSDDDEDNGEDGDDDEPDSVDNLSNHGTIEMKTEDFPVRSRLENSDVRNFEKIFVHPFGYPWNILIGRNKREIRRLIMREEFYPFIFSLRIEAHKLVVMFLANDSDCSNQLKLMLEKLAFRPIGRNYQLPLLTLPGNLMIEVFCDTNSHVRWERFSFDISFANNLSPSLWMPQETVHVANQVHRTTFLIDPITFFKIEGRRNWLDYSGTLVYITIVNNPLQMDINNIPAQNIRI